MAINQNIKLNPPLKGTTTEWSRGFGPVAATGELARAIARARAERDAKARLRAEKEEAAKSR